jgi:hypothetical protein
VAINSSNKALLTIMMSNNFVELKGSVFKKFDKNNLFQVKQIPLLATLYSYIDEAKFSHILHLSTSVSEVI